MTYAQLILVSGTILSLTACGGGGGGGGGEDGDTGGGEGSTGSVTLSNHIGGDIDTPANQTLRVNIEDGLITGGTIDYISGDVTRLSTVINSNRIESATIDHRDDGEIDANVAYTYNDANRLVSKVITDAETDSMIFRTDYTYNDEGNIATRATTRGGLGPLLSIQYTYNDEQQITESYYEMLGGASVHRDYHSYDSEGHLIGLETDLGDDGSRENTLSFTYVDGRLSRTREVVNHAGGVSVNTITHSYDDLSRPIAIRIDNGDDGSVDSSSSLSYTGSVRFGPKEMTAFWEGMLL